jgi:SHS2 domain-containing protein
VFYETIDDVTADAGIRVKGGSLEEVFCKAILATFNEITDIERVRPEVQRTLRAKGRLPFLLADLINEALVLHSGEGFVASRCEVLDLGEDHASVRVWGEAFDPERHTSKLVIKAATYHRLRVEREGDTYVAEVIFDI